MKELLTNLFEAWEDKFEPVPEDEAELRIASGAKNFWKKFKDTAFSVDDCKKLIRAINAVPGLKVSDTDATEPFVNHGFEITSTTWLTVIFGVPNEYGAYARGVILDSDVFMLRLYIKTKFPPSGFRYRLKRVFQVFPQFNYSTRSPHRHHWMWGSNPNQPNYIECYVWNKSMNGRILGYPIFKQDQLTSL